MQNEEIPTKSGAPEAGAASSVTDEKILAEFEARVLEGLSREKAERLMSSLFGRVALGTGGRTRAEIHGLVIRSEVRKPKKAEAEKEAETKAEAKAEAKEARAETVTELATEAFAAEGIWEPDEERYNLLVEALQNSRNAGTPPNIDVALEIMQAILAGGSHVALPAAKAEATTNVTFEASASSLTEAEALPVPTLVELEVKLQETLDVLKRSSWEWACALTAIHDSKLFPDSASAGSWEHYTEGRWGLGRSQSYRIVAWVHREIEMLIPSLESPEGDLEAPERKAPPATPIHGTEKASRAARRKPRKPAPKPAPKPASNPIAKPTPPPNGKPDFDISELGDPNDWGIMGSFLVKLHLSEKELKVLNKGLNPATPDSEVAVCGHKFLLSYRRRYTAVYSAGLG